MHLPLAGRWGWLFFACSFAGGFKSAGFCGRVGFGLRVSTYAPLFCLVQRAELRKKSPAKLGKPFGADVKILRAVIYLACFFAGGFKSAGFCGRVGFGLRVFTYASSFCWV